MKVVHTISQFYMGGAQTLLLDISKELNSRGVETEILCFSKGNDLEEKTRHLPYFNIIPSKAELFTSKQNKYTVMEAKKFIDSFKPDIIHSHLLEAEFITRAINYKKAKYFSHCHDNMPSFKNFSIKSFFQKSLLTNFYEKNVLLNLYRKTGGNHFIAISKDTYSYFNESLPDDLNNINLLYNAINFKRFFYSDEKVIKKPELKLVTVGSLVNKKNQSFLVDVVSELKQKNIKVQLDVLGDGPNRAKIERKIKDGNLQNEITLHGNVPNVESYLWNSDVYVHSATEEPFGLVLIEAMAARLPVVTLDGKGNRDLIEEGRNGFMLFENNAKKFSDQIVSLYQDEKKYKKISQYAVEYARNYDIRNYVDKLIFLYEESLGKAPSKKS